MLTVQSQKPQQLKAAYGGTLNGASDTLRTKRQCDIESINRKAPETSRPSFFALLASTNFISSRTNTSPFRSGRNVSSSDPALNSRVRLDVVLYTRTLS